MRVLWGVVYVALGAVGFLVMVGVQHAYQDHRNLHALVQMVTEAQAKAAKPPPTEAP